MKLGKMNQVYVLLFSALIFLCLSFLVNVKLPKYRIGYLVVGLIVYLVLSIILMFPFTDLLTYFLRGNGVKVYYSHNDMVLMFEILLVCFILFLINSVKVVAKYRRR
jgi:hypothetical protein